MENLHRPMPSEKKDSRQVISLMIDTFWFNFSDNYEPNRRCSVIEIASDLNDLPLIDAFKLNF